MATYSYWDNDYVDPANSSDNVPEELPKGWDHESQYESLIKNSRLYTPPKAEYQEPVEDLYDWDTGKIRST